MYMYKFASNVKQKESSPVFEVRMEPKEQPLKNNEEEVGKLFIPTWSLRLQMGLGDGRRNNLTTWSEY